MTEIINVPSSPGDDRNPDAASHTYAAGSDAEHH